MDGQVADVMDYPPPPFRQENDRLLPVLEVSPFTSIPLFVMKLRVHCSSIPLTVAENTGRSSSFAVHKMLAFQIGVGILGSKQESR